MERFEQHTGRAVSMPAANVDTDVIMPKQFLTGIDRAGLARGVFHNLRFDEQGRPRPDYLLNQPDCTDLSFLVVGPNFGCGSSREHAVWGLQQYGIRAILGTTYGGIFADNALNNGLLLVSLPVEHVAQVAARLQNGPRQMTIDLEQQKLIVDDFVQSFQIEPGARRMLMQGLDKIGETLAATSAIREFEARHFAANPWLVSTR
jgi:3-isopropylmalate/(R)-2-methylmalate dehydratase small subunit